MFTETTKQFTTTIKPFICLLEINTKSLEQLINLQKTFLTATCWEVAAQTKALTTQTDITQAMNDQQYYTDQHQTKVSSSVQKAYEVTTNSSEEVVQLVTESISDVVNSTKDF